MLFSILGAFLIPRNGSPDLADIKLAEQDVFFVLASTKMPAETTFIFSRTRARKTGHPTK